MIFKFRPLLKPTLWGGDRIAAMKQLSEVPLAEAEADSFVILIGVGGEGAVTAGSGRESLRYGESLLVAAECTNILVEGHVSLLAVYVP